MTKNNILILTIIFCQACEIDVASWSSSDCQGETVITEGSLGSWKIEKINGYTPRKLINNEFGSYLIQNNTIFRYSIQADQWRDVGQQFASFGIANNLWTTNNAHYWICSTHGVEEYFGTIYYSDNAGKTWKKINETSHGYFDQIYLNVNGEGIGSFVNLGNRKDFKLEIYQTRDYGESWDNLIGITPRQEVISMQFIREEEIIHVVGNNNILYSTPDYGFTWEKIDLPELKQGKSFFKNSNFGTYSNREALFISNNGGRDWNEYPFSVAKVLAITQNEEIIFLEFDNSCTSHIINEVESVMSDLRIAIFQDGNVTRSRQVYSGTDKNYISIVNTDLAWLTFNSNLYRMIKM